MSTPEEKREKKALYNKNHREKKKLKEQNSVEEKKEETLKEEKKEIEVIEEVIEEVKEEVVEKKEEIVEDISKVTLSREDYEWLIEQVQKQTLTAKEEPKKIENVPETVKSESFFFRLQTSIKNQMISSIASMGSVLALSLAIRGSQSLIQSMSNSSAKFHTSTKSNNQQQASGDIFTPRIVSVG